MAAPALRTGQASQQPADYLTEVGRLLWPPPASATLVRRRSGAAGGGLLVLPGLRRQKMIVPRGRRGGAAAIRRYGEPGSARAKVTTKSLAFLLAGGLGSMVGDRLVVSTPAGAPTIGWYLTQTLGQRVEVSLHVGAARANRKPVLQLLTPSGDTIRFAQIGINHLTADLVRAQHEALTRLADAALSVLPGPSGRTLCRVLTCGARY